MLLEEAPTEAKSERIGRYQLCFELASGGMATVYLARADGESGFEKLVALKRIHRHLAKERGYVDMFLDEARIASRITHANVCSVFDFGEANGEYYIAMEYLVGEPLSRVGQRVAKDPDQRRSPLLPARIARVIADACEGLHAAHELKDAHGELLNVVHRDASPKNLFLTYDGVVQVVDFGIASARQRVHQTSTGDVKGTFPYMAPEQLSASTADRRVDIWSLGVTLWELLTLRRLFRGDTPARTMHAVLFDDIAAPSEYRSQIPKELDEIVLKALDRDPDQRWQSGREMGKALRQFLAAQGEVLGPAELSEWMSELFPEGQVRKTQIMEIARMAGQAVPAFPPIGENDETDIASGLLPMGVPGVMTSGPSLRKRVALGALAASLVVAGVGVGLLSAGGNETTSLPVATAAPDPQEARPGPLPAPSEEREGPAPTGPPMPESEVEIPGPAIPVTEPSPPEETKPQKPRKATQRVQAGRGTINLVTRGGWAEIYKGKKLLGNTPRRLDLPSGRHRLVLKPFGEGKPRTVYVNVRPNQTKKVAVDLR